MNEPKTFLLTAPAMVGHVMPMLGIAQALSRRGHRVLFHTNERFEPAIRSAGATCLPYVRYQDSLTRRLDRQPPAWMPPLAKGLWKANAILRASIPELVEELEPILRRESVDCLVADFTAMGARYAAERTGVPFATVACNLIGAVNRRGAFAFNPVPLMDRLPERMASAIMETLQPLRPIRESLGLPRRRGGPPEYLYLGTSDRLHLVLAPRTFFPGVELRDAQEFPGPVSFESPDSDTPADVGPLAPGTVVVSTSTVQRHGQGLLQTLLRGAALLGAPVLATSSGASVPLPEGLGPHVRLERYISFERVFPQATALVTHGGRGTVGSALRHGLPMLIVPMADDQPLNGRRLEALGLAYHLPFHQATPEALRDKLSALLQDEGLRQRVRALSEELRAKDAAGEAARLLEGVAR